MILDKIKKIKKRTLTLIAVFSMSNLLFVASQYKAILSFFANYNSATVYVTQDNVHRGQPLRYPLVKAEKIDITSYKKNFYTVDDLVQITRYVFTRKMPAGTTLQKGDITLKDEDFIRAILKDGYRSVLLRVDTKLLSKDLVGGWRVDVTYTENSRSSTTQTILLLCALKVLDIDREGKYIILEASPDDALTLLSAYKTGTLNFLAVSRSESEYDGPTECKKPKKMITHISRGVS